MRITYTLTDQEYADLLAASRPVPLIAIHCGPVQTPQDRANAAWAVLARKRFFDVHTVEKGPTPNTFTAEPILWQRAQQLRAIAEPVGPRHDFWPLIFNVEAVLDGQMMREWHSEEEWIQFCDEALA